MAFKAQSQGCCQGRVYSKASHLVVSAHAHRSPCGGFDRRSFAFDYYLITAASEASYSCCGGKVLYDSGAQGCCLQNGPQVRCCEICHMPVHVIALQSLHVHIHDPTCSFTLRSTNLVCRIAVGVRRAFAEYDLASTAVATEQRASLSLE